MTPLPMTYPHGNTARRLDWVHLPPLVRRVVEQKVGSPVVESEPRTGGYTPGLASVLTLEDGARLFLKAASTKAQPGSARAYQIEARRLRSLPPGTPAPRLKWSTEVEDWVVIAIEYVDGRAPLRPWRPVELAAASSMLVDTARILTPAPGVGLTTFAEEFADYPAYWNTLGHLPHADEAAALAARFADVTVGTTLVHTDVRDDNLLVRPDGSVVMCDWNWPTLGAPWLDSLLLLIGPRGDGLDVDAHIAGHPLLADVPAESIDIVLALVTGFFLKSAADPVPPSSPWLREVQWWQGEVCWQWLCERRGWR